MTDHLLFNGIIIDLIIFDKKLSNYNYIDKQIVYNYKNLKHKQKIKTIFNLEYPKLKPLILIFNQNNQILKNIFRYILVQWKNKKKLLENNENIKFEHDLMFFNEKKININSKIILDEIEYFINSDKTKKQTLLYFIINSIQKYYKQF